MEMFDELNCPISHDEIKSAVNNLKNNESADPADH